MTILYWEKMQVKEKNLVAYCLQIESMKQYIKLDGWKKDGEKQKIILFAL